jgi:WD40 repeat protein
VKNNELAVSRRRSFLSFKENISERIESNGICSTETDCPSYYTKGKTIIPNNKIKVFTRSKPTPEFNNLYLQQELESGNEAIWVARFSADGYFFAVGGEDCRLRVWEVVNCLTQGILY